MNYETLMTFVSLAKTKSFTKTAEDVFCTQSTASLRIQGLESEYGIKLFHRVGKSVSLTEAGEIFLPHAELILSSIQEAGERIAQLKNLSSGKIDIVSSHTPGTYLLPSLLAEYRRAHPNIGINSHVQYAKTVIQELSEGHRFDFGLVSQPEPVADERLSCRFVMDDELTLVVAPDHPWAEGGRVTPEALEGETFLLSNSFSSLLDYLKSAIGEGFELKNVLVIGNAEAVKLSIKMKLGVSVISKLAVREETAKRELVEIDIEGMKLRRGIYLLSRKNRFPSPASEAFMTLLFGRTSGLSPGK